MSTSLFRKKSIVQIQADAAAGLSDHLDEFGIDGVPTLRRSLGVFDLTLMGIAAIIGAGIFAMIGKASYNGGPAVALLFVFTATACAFSALCYAEFASRIPVAGSAYTYAYASMGEFIAWIIGWDLIVEYAIGNIAVAISWSDYFTGLLKGYGIDIPLNFTMDFLTASRGFDAVQKAVADGATVDALTKGCSAADAAVNCGQVDGYLAWANAPHIGSIPIVADLPALLITLVITTLVFIGIRESKFAANIMTVLKIGIILLVIFLGLNYVNPENWSPFAPNGITGVLKGVSAVFFAYIGFDALSTTAEECKNPRRDLPIAMILSLVICTVLYIAVALVLTGMVSYKLLDVGDPLAFVFGPEGANIPWVAGLIAVSAVIALATVFLVFQIGQPRLWMAMSRDGLLPKIFSSIHPKFKTPWFATIVTGIVVAVPALFMNLTEVTDLASIGTLFAFVVVCAGVLFKDKEFKESGTRYVPYINSQFILPVLLIIVFGTIYYFNPTFLSDFLTLKPAEGESMLGAFSHKIPMIFFAIVAVLLVYLSLTKKLSLIPILGLLSCLYLMTELGVTNWIRFSVWLVVGIFVYALYGYKNSHLNKGDGQPVEA
ncbi:MAG TPA: amino acid permease [Pyrinomonadaceae bacterium]|nr:amino acid permease [Pyrinomonadaceae bacterium]